MLYWYPLPKRENPSKWNILSATPLTFSTHFKHQCILEIRVSWHWHFNTCSGNPRIWCGLLSGLRAVFDRFWKEWCQWRLDSGLFPKIPEQGSGWLFREVVVWDAVCPGSGADRALGPRSEAQDGVGERKLGTKTVAPLLPPDRSCD